MFAPILFSPSADTEFSECRSISSMYVCMYVWPAAFGTFTHDSGGMVARRCPLHRDSPVVSGDSALFLPQAGFGVTYFELYQGEP